MIEKISRENSFAKHYGFQSIDDLIEKSEQLSSPTSCGKYGYFITPLPNRQFMAWNDDSIEGICICGIGDSPAEASKNMFIKRVSSEFTYDGKDIGMLLQRFVEGKRLRKL